MSQYRRGAQFERDVINHLRAEGYDCIRSAGSKGKIDILAFKPGQILAIQCKLNGTLPPAERVEVFRLADVLGAVPVVAWKRPRHAQPLFDRMTGTGPRDRVEFVIDYAA